MAGEKKTDGVNGVGYTGSRRKALDNGDLVNMSDRGAKHFIPHLAVTKAVAEIVGDTGDAFLETIIQAVREGSSKRTRLKFGYLGNRLEIICHAPDQDFGDLPVLTVRVPPENK